MLDRCVACASANLRGRVRISSAETTAKCARRGFLVTNLVTRGQIRPLKGARKEPDFLGNSSDLQLGYQDSNLEQKNQNQPNRYVISEGFGSKSTHLFNINWL